MKIEKLNDAELLWSLDKEDFIENKLNVNDFLFGTSKARLLFKQAMKRAEKDLSFQVEGYLLYCQLKELTENGVIFSITRKGQLPGPQAQAEDEGRQPVQNEERLHLLYEFATLDDVIRVSRIINPDIPLDNSLYKMYGEYLLFVEPDKEIGEQMAWCTMNLAEFADVEAVTKGQKALLLEHSECILKEQALQKLRSIA